MLFHSGKNILKFLSYVDGVSDKVIVEDFGDFLNEERSRLLIKSKRMFVRVAIKVSPEADLKPFKGLGVSTCFNERLKGLEEETPIGKTCWKQSPIDRNKLIKDLKRSLISLQKNEKPHAVRNCLKIFRRTIQTHYGLVLKPNHTQVSCFINVRNDLYLRLVKLSSAYGFNSIKETAAYCVDPL